MNETYQTRTSLLTATVAFACMLELVGRDLTALKQIHLVLQNVAIFCFLVSIPSQIMMLAYAELRNSRVVPNPIAKFTSAGRLSCWFGFACTVASASNTVILSIIYFSVFIISSIAALLLLGMKTRR